jgi:hypothetical protein
MVDGGQRIQATVSSFHRPVIVAGPPSGRRAVSFDLAHFAIYAKDHPAAETAFGDAALRYPGS